jgi:hypothetical protein
MKYSDHPTLFQEVVRETEALHPDASLPPSLWSKMHHLAEVEYAPALPFFITLLDHSDWDWRAYGVELIGFHYQFAPDSALAERMRDILLNDPRDEVRMPAASVLSVRSQWPDTALEQALRTDSDDQIRRVAFVSLLKLAGVSFPVARQIEAQMEAGEFEPSPHTLNATLRDLGFERQIEE